MRPGRGTPLRDRQVDHGDGPDPPPIPAYAATSSQQGRRAAAESHRHCRVQGPPADPVPHAALLLGRYHDQATGDWYGLVVYVIGEGGPTAATVQAWLPATQLRPA